MQPCRETRGFHEPLFPGGSLLNVVYLELRGIRVRLLETTLLLYHIGMLSVRDWATTSTHSNLITQKTTAAP